jgi:uncharacterized membrane protein
MAKRIATQLIVAAFNSEEGVDDVEKEIMDQEFESKQILCTNMAVAKRDIAGKITIKEMGNPSALQGKPNRAKNILGGLSLLLSGSKGTAKAANLGGSFSAYGATQLQGMNKNSLEKIGAALKPGSSAIILVFDEVLVETTDTNAAFLQEYQEATDEIASDVAAKIDDALNKGQNVTFHFCIDENGVAMTREVKGADSVSM